MNVITHLENAVRRMEEQCNPDEIKRTIRSIQNANQLDSYLDDLVRQRKEINKTAIVCEKLKAVSK